MTVVHSSNVSYMFYTANKNYSILANYCSKCGKRVTKWFETWYAQGNCICLSVENKTLGTRYEKY